MFCVCFGGNWKADSKIHTEKTKNIEYQNIFQKEHRDERLITTDFKSYYEDKVTKISWN